MTRCTLLRIFVKSASAKATDRKALTHEFEGFVNTLFSFCQKQSGINIKLMTSSMGYMLGPIGFVLAGIAGLVSLIAYLEKVVGI